MEFVHEVSNTLALFTCPVCVLLLSPRYRNSHLKFGSSSEHYYLSSSETLRKGGCPCSTQCTEIIHVPSLSFASISMDEDAIKSRRQDEKMAALQKKLSAAREIAYRVADDKYRQTMRMLHMVDDKVIICN